MTTMRFQPADHLKSLLVLLVFAGLVVSTGSSFVGPVFAGEKCPSCECASCEKTPCHCEDRNDDIWLIDTRCAPCCVDDEEAANPSITFKRFNATSDTWVAATAEDFFGGADAALPTTFWVHGDRIEDEDVCEVGMSVYDRLVECQGVGRIRYVIWSWSAAVEYTLRPIKDAQLKGENGLQDGYRLGWVLARMPTETSVCLIGYSAAGRNIFGALHGMGGGRVAGYGLLDGLLDGERSPGPPRYSVVSFATAIDNYWLESGERFGLAASQIKRVLFLNNYRDIILQHYPKLYGTQALGFAGLSDPDSLEEQVEDVWEFNVSGTIGRMHRWRNYVYSDTVMAMIREYGLSRDVTVEGTTVEEIAGRAAAEMAGRDIADGGDVEMVDGAMVVIEDMHGRKRSALEWFADGGDVEIVDGIAVVIEDALAPETSAIEGVAKRDADQPKVFVEVVHRISL